MIQSTLMLAMSAALILPAADERDLPALTDHAAWAAWLMRGGDDTSWGASDNERAGRLLQALSSPDYDVRERATQRLRQCGVGAFPLLVADFRATRDLEKRLRIRKIAYERFMDEACPWFNAGFMGIQMNPRDEGMMVMQVLPGTAAADAGVQQFDVIVQVDQSPVQNDPDPQKAIESFAGKISGYRAGDDVELTLIRSGQFRRVTVTLGRRTQRYIRPENQTDLKDAETTFEAVWTSLVAGRDDAAEPAASEPQS